MVTDEPGIPDAIAQAIQAYDAGDQRMKSLFTWGAYTDRRTQQCECCGTPVVLLEFADVHNFPTTWSRWMEIKQDNGPDITDLVFYDHDQARCRSRRGHYDTHRS